MKRVNKMSWKEVQYSKKQINRAGKAVSEQGIMLNLSESIKIIDNWRAAHAYPLYVISNKLKRIASTKDYKNTFVVHRLKRLDSIIGKLKRIKGMSLYSMQDIGGCRVVTGTVKNVYDIANKYENSRIRHILYKENDYIQNPKTSGYRCLHRVYRYVSDISDSKYNKMCVEIQYRTRLQHLWATAVETMGLYTKTNLKASIGNDNYLRFFALVSSLFAIKERTPVVPNTYEDIDELTNEIIKIDRECQIINKLKAIRKAVRLTSRGKNTKRSASYYILKLDLKRINLDILEFKISEFDKATEIYNELERDNNIDVVLISAQSFDILEKAYPNYFGDVKKFIDIVSREINKKY